MCCMALGEAAGTAAAMSIEKNVRLRDLDVAQLQRTLVANNVNIGQSFRTIASVADEGFIEQAYLEYNHTNG